MSGHSSQGGAHRRSSLEPAFASTYSESSSTHSSQRFLLPATAMKKDENSIDVNETAHDEAPSPVLDQVALDFAVENEHSLRVGHAVKLYWPAILWSLFF